MSDDKSSEPQGETVRAEVPLEYASQRLDAILVQMFPDYSRSRLQQWVKAGRVRVDGEQLRPRDKLIGGETIEMQIEHVNLEDHVEPQNIPLNIVYEDEDILVINKPAGLVVHPAAGHLNDTLQNGLLFHDERLHEVPRSGIVHRLDKDTSGLLVVAKNLMAHKSLVEQLQARTVHREYQAIVFGLLTTGRTIDMPIGRHGRDRKKMAVKPDGKPAITHFRVLDRYRGHTRIRVNLETGRTHQIRVHMAYVKHPIVGDQTYGGRLQIPPGTGDELREVLRNFKRQALHARKLGLVHPRTGEEMHWKVPLPDDMKMLIAALEDDIAHTPREEALFFEYFSDEFTDEY